MTSQHIDAASGAGAALGGVIILLLIIAIGGGAYLAPSIIGWIRRVRDIGAVVVINVFLGWTLVGWVVALAMALRTATVPRSAVGQLRDKPAGEPDVQPTAQPWQQQRQPQGWPEPSQAQPGQQQPTLPQSPIWPGNERGV